MKTRSASADNQWVSAAVSRFEGPLTLYAARFLGDADAARDIVQDTFLRLCRQEPADLEGRLAEWLFTVCRNRALDVLRKEGRMTRLSDEHVQVCVSPEPDPPDTLERKDSAAQALAVLDTLPPSQREVIRLKFQNGFSYREISRISGHSVSNVGFLIHTGLKTIRQKLADGRPAGAHS